MPAVSSGDQSSSTAKYIGVIRRNSVVKIMYNHATILDDFSQKAPL